MLILPALAHRNSVTDGSAQRKQRGAFFTPAKIAEFISDWAIRTQDDRVLEPSCGDAQFLLSAAARLRGLGAGFLTGDGITAFELHPPSALQAQQRMRSEGFLADVQVGDFFDAEPSDQYDCVVGNPPYVRYQDFAGEPRRKALAAALRAGVRLNRLASSWAAFLVHATEFLKPDGRLGLVLPAELLSVKYAGVVRDFLLARFAHVRIVMFEELVFPGVQEEVILLLAEGNGGTPFFEVYHAQDISDLSSINRESWVPFSPGAEEKWLRALLPSDVLELYNKATSHSSVGRLLDWGDTYLGIVTGNNRYFTVSAGDAARLGFRQDELLKISPPGSRHLRGLSFSEAAWRSLSRDGAACYLFSPRRLDLSPGARHYVEAGEATGVEKGYKCRTRKPWWRPPLVPRSDLFLTYMDRDRPRLVSNTARVHHLNSLYGVRLHNGKRQLGRRLLPLLALSTVTLLGAELGGRAYGGGILKIEPNEADRLPFLLPAAAKAIDDRLSALRPQLNPALRKNDIEKASLLIDRAVLVQSLGFTHEEVQALRRARQFLHHRRLTRSGTSNG